MKPTYEELEQKLAESQREFRAADATIENLQMKLEKLSSENAGLKKFCKDAAFDADYEAELGMERGGFTDALNNIKTPATDAFLAEVRAQGVTEYASKRGFSFQHGCIHAHFGNGDVMVTAEDHYTINAVVRSAVEKAATEVEAAK
ncbi:hypothetical protein VRM73_002502 [Enterobacter hormaechei]|nr:hypothetical protein [Enterobacter hormaechei]